MTVQEIQKLQVGNLIIIGEGDNAMVAVVDRISRLTPVICKDVDRPVRLYEGHYLDFEKMKDGGFGWCTTDSPEFNEKIRPMLLEHFHGIPIPEDFEKINDTKMIPLLRGALTFVHEYQNAWHNSIGIKDDWKLK